MLQAPESKLEACAKTPSDFSAVSSKQIRVVCLQDIFWQIWQWKNIRSCQICCRNQNLSKFVQVCTNHWQKLSLNICCGFGNDAEMIFAVFFPRSPDPSGKSRLTALHSGNAPGFSAQDILQICKELKFEKLSEESVVFTHVNITKIAQITRFKNQVVERCHKISTNHRLNVTTLKRFLHKNVSNISNLQTSKSSVDREKHGEKPENPSLRQGSQFSWNLGRGAAALQAVHGLIHLGVSMVVMSVMRSFLFNDF